MSAKEQLNELLDRVCRARPQNAEAVKTEIEKYFGREIWSILKDEWNRMTNVERDAFARKVFESINK